MATHRLASMLDEQITLSVTVDDVTQDSLFFSVRNDTPFRCLARITQLSLARAIETTLAPRSRPRDITIPEIARIRIVKSTDRIPSFPDLQIETRVSP